MKSYVVIILGVIIFSLSNYVKSQRFSSAVLKVQTHSHSFPHCVLLNPYKFKSFTVCPTSSTQNSLASSNCL